MFVGTPRSNRLTRFSIRILIALLKILKTVKPIIPNFSIKQDDVEFAICLGTRQVTSRKFQKCRRDMKFFFPRVIFIVDFEYELRIEKKFSI